MFKRTYIVTFDVPAWDGYDPERFRIAIESYGIWGRVTMFSWIIVSTQSVEEIRNYLINFLPGNSRLFVAKVTAPGAWKGVICSDDWLRKTL